MYAPHNHSQALHRKRARQEDDLSMSLGEHRPKRFQCLPLRSSPRVPHQSLPSSNITPLNSDGGEQMSRWPVSPASPEFSSHPMQDTDTDMMDTASPQTQQLDLTRARLVGTEVGQVDGRMPTPILPSFAAQVRGQQCEWAGPGPAVTTLNGVVNMGHHQAGFTDDQCVPRTLAAEADWQSVHNNRRLPSPISEGEDSAMNSPGMILDGSFQNQLSTRLVNSSITSHPSPPHTMEHPNAMMDIESSTNSHAEDGERATTPSPGRRGHIRSRHTVNTWTLQPGMKRSFSIGYRADCEKCRLRVPGHFNHIIIS